MKNDLTVVFLTVNKVPQQWVEYHREVLLEAIGNYPLITVSKKPMPEMPGINILQEGEIGVSNIYRQMLRAAKIATTSYIAIAEDDTLYPREHFTKFRPQLDEFAYNMCRWSLFTWDEPTYSYRNRIVNSTLIAPRELMIQALEERFKRWPRGTPVSRTGELGKARIEKLLKLPSYKMVQFNTTIAIIQFNHIYSLDPGEVNKRKRRGFLRAYDIPYWGKADNLVKNFTIN